MNNTAAHSALVNEILLALAQPDVRLFVNMRGHAVHRKSGRHYEFGLVDGASDLIGIGPGGRFVALEVKTGKAVPTKEQKDFIAMILLLRGIAGVVHSVSEAVALIEAARS